MLTINLAQDQVTALEVAPLENKMPASEAWQMLNAAESCFEQATSIWQEKSMPLVEEGISFLRKIEDGQGWSELPYKSIHQAIQAKLGTKLRLSVSQIYRRIHADRVRHVFSQFCENADDIPDSHLLKLERLPAEQWEDTWQEIVSNSANARVTAKRVKDVVDRRLKTENGSPDEPQPHTANEPVCFRHGYEYEPSTAHHENSEPSPSLVVTSPPKDILDKVGQPCFGMVGGGVEMADDEGCPTLSRDFVTPYLVGEIALVQCTDSASPKQQQYSGCWGIIRQLLGSTAIVAVCGEPVEYFFSDLNPIENPHPALMEVCDRVMNLWQISNLPASVQHLLATFYQQRLDFSQSDLAVLAAISTCVTPEEQADYQTNTQNNIKEPGVDNQITSIIFPIE